MDGKQMKQIKKYRGTRTQKEYAKFLNINIRTIQNWENRGTGKTTLALLKKINELQDKIKQLEKKLKDENMTFQL